MAMDRLGRTEKRLLRFLVRGPVVLRPAALEALVLLDGADRGCVAIASDHLQDMQKKGRVTMIDDKVSLTREGRCRLSELSKAADIAGEGDFDDRQSVVVMAVGGQTLAVNENESPLSSLRRRTGRDGARFLTEREFRAGERLRADYSRGQIIQRLGINWGAAGGGGRKLGDANGIADLTDAALAARQRVERAVDAVGPELAGVLIDICCFLKGLERVEIERRWPARSAKVVLKSALAALARHYEPARNDRDRHPGTVLHWGTPDFRPHL